MSTSWALVALLTAGIALYIAIALVVRTMSTTKPVTFVATQAPMGGHKGLALVLRPVNAAISCVGDRNEHDWTWQQYTAVALLLALLSLMILALLGAGITVWTLL